MHETLDNDQLELEENQADKLLLLNITKTSQKYKITDYALQTTCAWKIKPERACEAEYILAVVSGVVKQVFVANKWILANKETFPDRPDIFNLSDRYGFQGEVVEDEKIRDRYINKNIIDLKIIPSQNPVRYLNM